MYVLYFGPSADNGPEGPQGNILGWRINNKGIVYLTPSLFSQESLKQMEV